MSEANHYPNMYDTPSEMSMMPGSPGMEGGITNIVGQIDPQTIIDNLDHALKGEQWDKEQAKWIKNDSGESLVNDACRSAVVSYLDGILNNNTTMAHIDENRVSLLMESVIRTIKRMFVCNLEKFGFVPPGPRFANKDYYNKGSPDTSRMSLVANMVYKVCFLVFTRAIKGAESYRIFKSLQMTDSLNYNQGMPGAAANQGFLSKLFGKKA